MRREKRGNLGTWWKKSGKAIWGSEEGAGGFKSMTER